MERQGGISPKPSTNSVVTISDEPQDISVKADAKLSLWQRLNETWLFEGLGFLIGASCLIVTAGILYHYDGEVAPEMPVTLNFIMSLLGNVAFASTLFAIHGAVSQLKWIDFSQRSRPLSDLDAFRRVGGGPLGATRLLLTASSRPLVVVVSIAIIFGMLWAPFTQNMVRYESEASKALLPRSVQYKGSRTANNSTSPLDPFLIPNMQTALSAQQPQANNLRYLCSTGDCTWPLVTTLALRSNCTDISQSITLGCKEDQHCDIKLPGNNTPALFYDNQSGKKTASLYNVSLLPQSDTPQVYKNKQQDTIIQALRRLPPYPVQNMETNQINKESFAATECTLYLAVIRVLASVTQNTYTETVLDEWVDPTWNGSVDGDIRSPWESDKRKIFYIPKETRDTWNRTGNIGGFPYSEIVGVATMSDETISYNGTETGNLIFNTSSAYICPDGSQNKDTFACAMTAVADGITKTFRNSAYYRTEGFDESSSGFIAGQTYNTDILVRVDWYWITLPVAVWLIGLVVWLAVMVQSRRLGLPVWRGNALPLLYLYRDSKYQSGMELGEVATMGGKDPNSNWAYQEAAGRVNVRLKDNGDGVLRLGRE